MEQETNITIQKHFSTSENGGNFFQEVHTVVPGRETIFMPVGNTTMYFLVLLGDPNRCNFTLNGKPLPAGTNDKFKAIPGDNYSYTGFLTILVTGCSHTSTAKYQIYERE